MSKITEIDFSEQISPKEEEASPAEEQKAIIEFSKNILEALESKAEQHNEENPGKKVTFAQLKKVYVRGAGDCHDAEDSEYVCGEWAMARVNMFLSMKLGDKPNIINKEVNIRSFVDISDSWIPSENNFAKAKEDIEKYKLNYKYNHIEELYLAEEKSSYIEFI
jgi:hypothetical protein